MAALIHQQVLRRTLVLLHDDCPAHQMAQRWRSTGTDRRGIPDSFLALHRYVLVLQPQPGHHPAARLAERRSPERRAGVHALPLPALYSHIAPCVRRSFSAAASQVQVGCRFWGRSSRSGMRVLNAAPLPLRPQQRLRGLHGSWRPSVHTLVSKAGSSTLRTSWIRPLLTMFYTSSGNDHRGSRIPALCAVKMPSLTVECAPCHAGAYVSSCIKHALHRS